MEKRTLFLAILLTALCAGWSGCGFHLMGRGVGLPDHIQTIGVETFKNETTHFEVDQIITDALVNELLRRKGYKVILGSRGADAALSGTVVEFKLSPVEFDERSYATRVEITIRAEVIFVDQTTKGVLWKNDNYLFQDQYDVETTDFNFQEAFFDEEVETVERIAEDFAKTVVSALLEGF